VKKKEGLELLDIKIPKTPMSEMLLIDWYAGMALMNCHYANEKIAATYAFDIAKAMMAERTKHD
tara:strand:+ start:6551 stop:6742 length:192 start_codon:yes stop_codon:yes gene_type:complete